MSRKKIILNFNSKVKEELTSKGINIHDGLAYLMCLHYGIEPTYIPEPLKRKILACNIVSKDYNSNTIVWKETLFEESIKGFEWVGDWMDLFKQVNPARRGTKKFVLTRMKKFFINNPEVRTDDVMAATKKYLGTIENPTFCKSSHKFIYEADGSSMLESYVELIKSQGKGGSINRMVI